MGGLECDRYQKPSAVSLLLSYSKPPLTVECLSIKRLTQSVRNRCVCQETTNLYLVSPHALIGRVGNEKARGLHGALRCFLVRIPMTVGGDRFSCL